MVRGVEQLQKGLRDDDAVLAGCHTAVDAVGAVRGIRVVRKTVSRPFAIASGDGRGNRSRSEWGEPPRLC